MATLEEAKAFLKKDAGDGSNLYDHLSEVLLKILVERPENLRDSFEHLSASIKQQRYVNQTQNIQDGTSKLVVSILVIMYSIRALTHVSS
jgi:radial spoke head protein 4A